MQIQIKISPQLNDLLLVAQLVDRLADLSGTPEAEALRRDIKTRLKRLKTVGVS
jgi:hypothetical protein